MWSQVLLLHAANPLMTFNFGRECSRSKRLLWEILYCIFTSSCFILVPVNIDQ